MTQDDILEIWEASKGAVSGPWSQNLQSEIHDGYSDLSSPNWGGFLSVAQRYDEASGGGAIPQGAETLTYLTKVDPQTVQQLIILLGNAVTNLSHMTGMPKDGVLQVLHNRDALVPVQED